MRDTYINAPNKMEMNILKDVQKKCNGKSGFIKVNRKSTGILEEKL